MRFAGRISETGAERNGRKPLTLMNPAQRVQHCARAKCAAPEAACAKNEEDPMWERNEEGGETQETSQETSGGAMPRDGEVSGRVTKCRRWLSAFNSAIDLAIELQKIHGRIITPDASALQEFFSVSTKKQREKTAHRFAIESMRCMAIQSQLSAPPL
jgi:hypothetical protein